MADAPERKNPLEQLEVPRRSERVCRGKEDAPIWYPYHLQEYELPFPHLGTEPQLFLDNYPVEWLYDLERVMEQPRKVEGPVMRFDGFAWEGAGRGFG